MRVISGKAGGLKLFSPKGDKTRPTADKTKEAIFNILAPLLYEADFLDLFAGTGAIGIEALSRNAGSCVFVEQSVESIEIINKNLEHTKLTENARVITASVKSALNRLGKEQRSFNIIFLDPPYRELLVYEVLKDIVQKGLLKHQGIIVCEVGNDGNAPPEVDGLCLVKQKKYGAAEVLFYELTQD